MDDKSIIKVKKSSPKKGQRKSNRLVDKENSDIKSEEISYDIYDEDLLQLMFKSRNKFQFKDDSDEEDILYTHKENNKKIMDSQRSHLEIIQSKNSFTCKICTKEFSDLNSLKSHILEELRNSRSKIKVQRNHQPIKDDKIKDLFKNLFSCDICTRKFMVKQQLDVHKQAHENMTVFTCSTCQRNFVSDEKLREHLEVHIKKYCAQCPAIFRSEEALRRHTRADHRHLEPRRYQCKLCLAIVTNILAHITVHKVEGTFCHLCHQHFTKPSEYELHRRKCEVLFQSSRTAKIVTFDVACGLNEPNCCVHKDADVAKINVLLNSKCCETDDSKLDTNEGNSPKRRKMD